MDAKGLEDHGTTNEPLPLNTNLVDFNPQTIERKRNIPSISYKKSIDDAAQLSDRQNEVGQDVDFFVLQDRNCIQRQAIFPLY